uniref:RBR-type E3 ubiquitin transferase n=1 Tax=Lygus hesperus TaxID=30085 RepID=A0A0A9X9G4_LYGHE
MVQCPIPYCNSYTLDKIVILPCGHYYCINCMYGKLIAALDAGIEALHTICAYPLNNTTDKKICKQLIPYNVFDNILLYYNTHEECTSYNSNGLDKSRDKDYYSIYLTLKHRNFGENSRYHINCPRCSRVIQRPIPAPQQQIRCICDQSICLKCGEAMNHSPLPCDLVKVFYSICTNSNEDLIRAITKSCPSCHVLIEKDRNCNHMTCTRCGYQFCWLCKGSWDLHISSYECPRFAKEESMTDDAKNEYETTIKYARMLQSTELVKIEFTNRRKITQDFQIIAKYVETIDILCTKKQYQSIIFTSEVSEYITWSGILLLYCEANPTRELLHQSVRSIEKI